MLRALRTIALILALHLAGCSFAIVSGVPQGWEKSQPPDCTSNANVPALDAAMALLLLGGGGWLAYHCVQLESFDNATGTACAMYGTLVALPLSGSIYGFITTNRCLRAEQEHEQWKRERLDEARVPGNSAPTALDTQLVRRESTEKYP